MGIVPKHEWDLTVIVGLELRVFLKQIAFGHRKLQLEDCMI